MVSLSNEFTPGKLPSNDYAFKNMLFVHPDAFKNFFSQNGNREPVFVEVKNFVLRLAPLDSIGVGEFGASSLQKDAMKISKIDTIKIALKKVRDDNPLGGLTVDLSLIFCNPDAPMEQGLVKLETDQIKEAIQQAFDKKFINWGEIFPLTLLDGKLVLKVKVTKIESFKQDVSQTFGMVTAETIVSCNIQKDASKTIKIISNEVKQIFKENISF